MLLPGAVLVVLLASPGEGQEALRDSFETPQAKWSEPAGQGSFRVERHERASDAHSGTSSEALVINSSNDGPLFLAYAFEGARVIEELDARVWVKANRPGIQLAAQIVLPRSRGRDGNPLTIVIAGSAYGQPGAWQELQVTGLPKQLEREVRSLRFTFGPEVDVREAYVDRLLLNVGGRGVTTILIDDVAIYGVAGLGALASPAIRPISTSSMSSNSAGERESRRPPVRLNGPTLLVGDAPMLVRAIEYRGEPLEYLRNLGFNAVKLLSPPTPEMAAHAERLGLWIICPPPRLPEEPASAGPPAVLSREFDRVLAWDGGEQLAAGELEETKRRIETLHTRDRELSRPVVLSALTDLRAYSRHAEIMLLDRAPIGSSLELPQYMQWLRERARLARPMTPIWATIQTEPLAELEDQLTRLSGGRVRNQTIQAEQLRLVAYSAIAGGAKGLIFRSRSRLDDQSPANRHRARALELLNIDLSIAEPWAASSGYLMTVPGSDPEALAAVFETNQSRVLLPLWSGKGTQYVPGQLAGTNLTFVVPGVPESFNAYEVTPADLPSPRTRRVAGGTRVLVDEFSLTGVMLLTNDPAAIAHVEARLQTITPRAAALARESARERMRLVQDVNARLEAQGQTFPKAGEYMTLAQAQLADCEALFGAGRHAAAFLAAERAIRPLRLIEHGHWKALTAELPTLNAAPFLTSVATMSEHRPFVANMAQTRFAPTDLVGGDFEQRAVLEQTGWRHVHDNEPGVKTGAELSAVDPRFGRFSLRLWAQPVDQANPPAVLERVPVWITSPPVNVAAGELLRIRGWVKSPGGTVGSVDGVLVFDSIGGMALAERIPASDDWREFTCYRVAPQSGPIQVQFALTGLGQAYFDEVTIERATYARQPARGTTPLPPPGEPSGPQLRPPLAGRP